MYVVIYIVLLSWYFSLDFTLSIFVVDICVISTIVHAGKPVECILIIGILKEDMKGSSFRKIYTGEVRYPKEMPKNSIAPSLLSTKVSTKKKSDVSRNVRRMRSERVNLFFVSLFAWLRTFWRVPLRKFSRFRPLKISRERYQPIIMTGKSLPDVLSTALRPVEYAAATYCTMCQNNKKLSASSWFIMLHPDLPRFILTHPDSSWVHLLVKFVFQNELR